jgi:hypothetical protein
MSSVESLINKNSTFSSNINQNINTSPNNKILLNGKDILKFSSSNNSSPTKTISITANKLFNTSNIANCSNNNQLKFKPVINNEASTNNSNNKIDSTSPTKLTNSPSDSNSISSLMLKLNSSNLDKNLTHPSSPIKIKTTNFNIPKNSPNKLEIILSSSLANGIKSLENKLTNDIKMIKIPKIASAACNSSSKVYPLSLSLNSDENILINKTPQVSLTPTKANSIIKATSTATNTSTTINKFNKNNFIIHKKSSLATEVIHLNENDNSSRSKSINKPNFKKHGKEIKINEIKDRSRSSSKTSSLRSRSSSSCCSSNSSSSSYSSSSNSSSGKSTCSKNSLHNNNFEDASYSPISDDSLLDTIKTNENNFKVTSKKRKLKKNISAIKKKHKLNDNSNKTKAKRDKEAIQNAKSYKKKDKKEVILENCREIKDELFKTLPTSSASSTPIKKFKNKSKIYQTLIRKNINEQLNENQDDNESSPKSASAKKKKRKTQISESKIDTFHQKLLSSQNQQFEVINQKVDNLLLEFTSEERKLFDSLITKEYDANGGAYILIAYYDQLVKNLVSSNGDDKMLERFSSYFLQLSYSESVNYDNNNYNIIENETTNTTSNFNESMSSKENIKENNSTFTNENRKLTANYVLGIIRNSAADIPEIIDYFAEEYPQMTVKTSLLLNNKEVNTMKISDYRKCVNSTYLNGTYRFGPLLQISLVGCRNEEIGDYFPDFIEDHLEKNVFLKKVMPWGEMSINYNMNPMNSDDGPIVWARPGEQMIPTSNLKDQHMSMNLNTISNQSGTTEMGKKKK